MLICAILFHNFKTEVRATYHLTSLNNRLERLTVLEMEKFVPQGM